jgi:hypothetical protein
MRLFAMLLCVAGLLQLWGCGSLLASMQMGKIDGPPNERTVGQMLEDDNIETKATVNLHASNVAYHEVSGISGVSRVVRLLEPLQ